LKAENYSRKEERTWFKLRKRNYLLQKDWKKGNNQNRPRDIANHKEENLCTFQREKVCIARQEKKE